MTQRLGAHGQTLEFHSSRLPDGGLVISFSDVSARTVAETQLANVNQSLEGRVEERTAALVQVNSELEIARAKADAANRDKTRFLAAASHDLLQPLNAARLYTSTLVERAGGTGLDRPRALDRGVADGSRGNHVGAGRSSRIEDARAEAGGEPVPGARPAQEKIDVELAPMAVKKEIGLRLVDTSLAVLGDRALAAIVQNLVSNAIKYTRPGGRVLVGARLKGQRVRIDIIDTGIGFNKDQHALIFAEFSRLEHGARMAQGLGLGLSIVKRLVTARG